MITQQIKQELMKLNQEYINQAEDCYDFWNMHIKYVVCEAINLAKTYGADLEIVELGALLHDIALVANAGTKADHHTNGAIIAKDLLTKYNYPQDKLERVLGCIINHRSSKNATNIEELCVADADIIAHFFNLPNAFVLGVKKHNYSTPQQFMAWLECDYNDLSDQTKISFFERYSNIMKVLFGDLWNK